MIFGKNTMELDDVYSEVIITVLYLEEEPRVNV